MEVMVFLKKVKRTIGREMGIRREARLSGEL